MANSLLDFVMSLVRDPDAAARFAENPDQAILDANLTNVTSADVSNLIPVVTESLGGNVPTVGDRGHRRHWQTMSGPVAPRRPRSTRSAIKCQFRPLTTCIRRSPTMSIRRIRCCTPGSTRSSTRACPVWSAPMTASLQFDQPVIDDLPVDRPAGPRRSERHHHRGRRHGFRPVGVSTSSSCSHRPPPRLRGRKRPRSFVFDPWSLPPPNDPLIP